MSKFLRVNFFKTSTFLVLITFLSFPHLNNAQGVGSIKGKIIDGSTDELLFGANVIIQGTVLGSSTDFDGNFIIRNIPEGEQTIEVSYIGYNSKSSKVTIVANRTLEMDFELDYKVIEGEVVVVTGQVEGQIQAINQQISSNTIANVVSKSRIEELPDVNAAESIGRLPGVSISRSGGEANKVAIRGLSPKYNTVTVNGVRLPSNSADDRSVDLSLISSNMLAGIEVKKANTADMDADALGGTIDLRLKEAPDGFKMNLNAQGGFNDMLNDWGNYNFNGTVSNRFLDGNLGIILGFNADQYNRSSDQYSGSYTRRDTPEGITENIISSMITRDINTIRDRLGASLVLDYKIPNGKISLNGFYNQLGWEQFRMEQTYNLSDNRHYFLFRDNGGTTDIFTSALGAEQDFGWMKYDIGVSMTGSTTEAPFERGYNFVREGGSFIGAVTADTHPNEIPDFATNDASRIGLQDVYSYETDRDENQSAVQFNLEFPVTLSNDISGYIKAGAKFRWLDRMNNQDQWGRNGLYYGNQGSNPNEFLTVLDQRIPEWDVRGLWRASGVMPLSFFLTDYKRNNFLNNEYPIGFVADFDLLHQMYNAFDKVTDSSGTQLDQITIGSLANDYEGVEHYQAAYAMAELSLGKYFTLIPGIRFENDYSKYTAHVFREVTINNRPAPPADLDTVTATRQNDFLLPMIHLIAKPNDWLKIRMAFTQTLTRPDFIQYAPITRINSQNNYMRAANTDLRPSVSTNYDLSVSVYENHVGLFTVSGFYKSIKDLIFQYNYPINADIPLHEGFQIPDNWATNVQYGADTYVNNENNAFYSGIELDWQTNLWYIPYLEGVVLNVNYTRIFSEMDKQQFRLVETDSLKRPRPPVYYKALFDTLRSSRLPDQPAHILNITLGYDYKGFSARLSYLYQTDKVTYIDNNKELDQFTGEYSRWDLTLQQVLMPNLQLFCNFTNLNETPDESFRGTSLNNPTFIEYYGLTIDFGMRYRL